MRLDDLTERELTYPRIPKAPRLPRVYGKQAGGDRHGTEPVPESEQERDWTAAVQRCAAVCLAGAAALLLGG